jgi:hypothetical protein
MIGIRGAIHVNKCLFYEFILYFILKCWEVCLNLNKKYLNVMSP